MYIAKENTMFTGDSKEPRPHTSFSQIDTYQQCPRKWAFRYVYKLERERLSHYLIFGSAVHTVLARIYAKKMLSNDSTTPEEAVDFWVDDFDKAIDAAEMSIDYGKTGYSDLQTLGMGMVEEFASKPLGVIVVGVEKEFRADIIDPATGEVMDKQMLGYLDALVMAGGELVVHEHKTAARKWSDRKIADDLQASIYLWATNASRLTFNVLMKTKMPRVDRHQTSRTEAEIELALQSVVNGLKGQQAGLFEAKRVGPYGNHCATCEFSRQCENRGPI